VGELERDLQIVFQSLEEEKMQHAKTQDSWIAESGQFKMVVKDMQLHIADLNEKVASLSAIKQNLEMETHALVDYNQQLEDKMRYIERESTETVGLLKDGLGKSQEELARRSGECQNLQIGNATLLKEI
jgi:FtsZ-binding cell division protein ZapB